MEMTGETLIAAPRAAVWDALNDAAVLARCIEGVETLERGTDDEGRTRFDGKMNAKVGPVRATFAGGVTVTEPDPPHRYVLVGEGKGGVAGFARGQAEIVLDEADGGTLLKYSVTSSVGGKLAQLGSRLIEGTAKAYAASFFERFKIEVEAPSAGASFAAGASDAGLGSTAAEAGLAGPGMNGTLAGDVDTGLAEGAVATGTLPYIGSDPQAVPGVAAARGGLPPLVWGGLLVLIVAALLIWQMS